MAKSVTLTGRTEILAAIYNPQHLPSASILANPSSPFCLHSLRTEGLSYFENTFLPSIRGNNNVSGDDPTKDEELKVDFYPFVEEAPYFRQFSCTGCYYGNETEGHHVRDSAVACTKTCEECA